MRSTAGLPATRGSHQRTVMKLVSPVHRGTRWTCRCPGIPPPAGLPRLRPTLIPSSLYASRSAASDRCVNNATSFNSSIDRSTSVGTMPTRHDHQVAVVVGIAIEDDVRERSVDARSADHVRHLTPCSGQACRRRNLSKVSPPSRSGAARGTRGGPTPMPVMRRRGSDRSIPRRTILRTRPPD